MITWNHRVVRDAEGLLHLSEVHYNEADKPVGFTDPFMCGESIMELVELLERLTLALKQPILDESECKPAPLPHEVTDGVTITMPTPETWNKAADIAIEAMLRDAGIVFPRRGE